MGDSHEEHRRAQEQKRPDLPRQRESQRAPQPPYSQRQPTISQRRPRQRESERRYAPATDRPMHTVESLQQLRAKLDALGNVYYDPKQFDVHLAQLQQAQSPQAKSSSSRQSPQAKSLAPQSSPPQSTPQSSPEPAKEESWWDRFVHGVQDLGTKTGNLFRSNPQGHPHQKRSSKGLHSEDNLANFDLLES